MICTRVAADMNFDFMPKYIFGFIILWQLLQLLFLWLERQRKQKKQKDTRVEYQNTKKATIPLKPQLQPDTPPENQTKQHAPQPSMGEIEFNLEQERDAWVITKQKSRLRAPILNIPHAASHIEVAIQASRAIEEMLERKLGAYGKGLHSKLSSVEGRISSSMVKKIRWIATIRNNTVHSTSASFEKLDFIRATQDILSYLKNL